MLVAPAAAAPLSVATGATSWANGSFTEIFASTSGAIAIAGLSLDNAAQSGAFQLDIAVGAAASEVVVGTIGWQDGSTATSAPSGFSLPYPLGGIANGVRLSCRLRCSVNATQTSPIFFQYYSALDSDQQTSSTQAYTVVPSAANGVTVAGNTTAWADSAWGELSASVAISAGLAGLITTVPAASLEWEIDLGTGGAGSETVITTLRNASDASGGAVGMTQFLAAAYGLAATSRVAYRWRKSGTDALNLTAHLSYITGAIETGISPSASQSPSSSPSASISPSASVSPSSSPSASTSASPSVSISLSQSPSSSQSPSLSASPSGSTSASPSLSASASPSPSPEEEPEVIGPTGSILHVFSDMHMQCPPGYYGGYKDGRIERAGYGERSLSDMVTGDPVSSTFTVRLSDYDQLLRRALASTDRRYWTVDPVPVHMTTRANRAVYGRAYLVFNGLIIDAQPSRPMSFDITLGDIISHRFLTDRAVHPSRKIGDGFIHDVFENTLGTRVWLSTAFDYHTPEPIIYGQHRRVRTGTGPEASGDSASQHGFEVDLTHHYLGVWNIAGGNKHVWIVAGHACYDIPDANTVTDDGTHNSIIPEEGTAWRIPHYAGWDAIFGAPYVDIHSTSFGGFRRYTLILGDEGSTEPDACAYASGGYSMDDPPETPLRLMAFVDGVETNGDSTGDLIIEMAQCYKHWCKNWGARSAAESYQFGPWFDSPTWTMPFGDGTIVIVDEASFDAVTAINQIRFPALNGYPCAAIIGAKAGDIHPMTKWMSNWNRSGFCASGWTNTGQYRIATPHPTNASKASARLITDAYEMRQGSFNTSVKWDKQANRIPVQGDPDYASGRLMTSTFVDAGDSIINYDQEILGDARVLPFAPGIAMLTHIGFLHAWLFKHPPRHVVFDDTVGPDYLGDSLGYLKLGEWVKYTHYAQVGEPGQVRLAWVIRHHINAGERRVQVEAWDVEELIDFGIPTPVEDVEPLNETCEDAIVVTNGADEPYAINLNTEEHATDPEVADIVGLTGPAVGYHAAWWVYTPPSDGSLFLTTVHSLYDTQIAVCTGECGSLTLHAGGYNDNDGALTTSVLDIPVFGGVPLHIVVYGYGPHDGGALTFGLLFTSGAVPWTPLVIGPHSGITCSG